MHGKDKLINVTARLSLVLAIALFWTVGASAALAETLFTYSGSRIWSKESVSTASVSGSICSVDHHQSRNNKGVDRQMTVYIQKLDGLDWEDTASRTFKNENGGTFSSYCSSGTYRLYFYSGSAYSKFDVYGSFYR